MEENNKILEECNKLETIFTDKNSEDFVTYEDFSKVIQSILNLIGYTKTEYNKEVIKCFAKIYEDMFRLHGYDKNGKRLDN